MSINRLRQILQSNLVVRLDTSQKTLGRVQKRIAKRVQELAAKGGSSRNKDSVCADADPRLFVCEAFPRCVDALEDSLALIYGKVWIQFLG